MRIKVKKKNKKMGEKWEQKSEEKMKKKKWKSEDEKKWKSKNMVPIGLQWSKTIPNDPK